MIHEPEQRQRILYSIPELGGLTGRSARSWWRDIRAGAISTVKLGGRVFVTAEAVAEFIEKKTDRMGAPIRTAPPHIARKVEAAARREEEQAREEAKKNRPARTSRAGK